MATNFTGNSYDTIGLISFRLFGIMIIFNRLQKLNAYQSIVSTPSGIQILSRLAQFSNAKPLILFSPFDNFTYFNLLHSINDSLPR